MTESPMDKLRKRRVPARIGIGAAAMALALSFAAPAIPAAAPMPMPTAEATAQVPRPGNRHMIWFFYGFQICVFTCKSHDGIMCCGGWLI